LAAVCNWLIKEAASNRSETNRFGLRVPLCCAQTMSAPAPRTVIFGCDHGAVELKVCACGRCYIPVFTHFLTSSFKNFLRDHVKTKEGIVAVDVGVHTPDAVDYPDVAALVCKQVLSTPGSAGIVLCGSGIGISIACNKINGIRCALCHDYYSAEMYAPSLQHLLYTFEASNAKRMCRKHNDANVMSLGGRSTGSLNHDNNNFESELTSITG
jgi:ribose 5-phosphate isomerase RpiB